MGASSVPELLRQMGDDAMAQEIENRISLERYHLEKTMREIVEFSKENPNEGTACGIMAQNCLDIVNGDINDKGKCKRINITIPENKLEEFDDYCKQHNITRSKLLQIASEWYMKNYESTTKTD